jgi:hypothetical protein
MIFVYSEIIYVGFMGNLTLLGNSSINTPPHVTTIYTIKNVS